MTSKLTFFWHDYETSGINPRWARPTQFAGVRTDENLNTIGEPLMVYCQPSMDTLPSPDACLVTGITPQQCLEQGIPEAAFAKKILAEFSVPGTCGVGYNSIRFDDEFTRHLCYRNFYDPYEREWKNGNSRWDILDMMRMMYALRPDGMQWPVSEEPGEEGRPVFKLEALTKANNLVHDAAHDALSDVMATIALARKVRELQPRLFDYALSLRDKRKVAEQLDVVSHKPVFHVSSKLKWQHGYASLMMPLCKHPTNGNGVICYDLMVDPAPVLELSAAEIVDRVFVKTEDLPQGVDRVPLKTIHLNKSPMVGSLKLLDQAAAKRLDIDVAYCEQHWQQLLAQKEPLIAKVREVMNKDFEQTVPDPEFNLYGGFIGDDDKNLCQQVRNSSSEVLQQQTFAFSDKRLPEMLFRYRARNFPESLTEEEEHIWEEFRFERLNEKISDDAYDLETYHSRIAELAADPANAGAREQKILADLAEWGDQIL